MELYEMPASRLAEGLRGGEFTPLEILESVWARIEAVEGRIGAFLHRMPESAARQAEEAGERLQRARREGRLDELPPLLGIPVAVKDNLSVAGAPMTCGSRMLENYVAPYDAAVVEALKAEGAPIVGKTNLDEFAMGSSTETSALGVTRNPWRLDRSPGGSSGGSAAAVAAGAAPIALGSDTGGSIRQPAAFCGIVGMRPTYGRVSRFGLAAFASSLDQVGPMARNVEDAAWLLQAIAGSDRRDSTSIPGEPPDFTADLDNGAEGLRIGLAEDLFIDGMEPQVEEAVRSAVAALEREGARVVEVSLPHAEYALAAYYLIATAEASSNLARYDGVRFGLRDEEASDVATMFARTRARGFGDEVKRRIILGTFALSEGYYEAYYLRAQKARELIRREFEAAFEACDVLAAPTSPTTAFPLGERADDPVAMYMADALTVPFSLAGLPALSLPCGRDAEGLPIGLQIAGPRLQEALLFRVGRALEKAVGWHDRVARVD